MKYWVFDLDGTLIDSHSIYYESLRLVLNEFDAELFEEDRAHILRIAARNRIDFFTFKLGEHRAPEALRRLEARFVNDHLLTGAFEGIKPILEGLRASDVPMAVWTARELDSALQVLDHIGLRPFFSSVVSGDCVSHCKPDPEGLRKIIQHFGCLPTEILMIGDHDNDVRAAKSVGAKAARVQWHTQNPVRCPLADWQFNSVDEFAHFTKSLSNV